MTTKMTTDDRGTSRLASLPRHWLTGASRRLKTALVLLALLAAGFTTFRVLSTADTAVSVQNQLYMPVVDPIVEPDRPDLIAESLTDE